MQEVITEKLYELLDHVKDGNTDGVRSALKTIVECKLKLREQLILKELEQE